MTDVEYWTKQLREAEQELEAATRRSDVNEAASKLQRARAQLKRLEAQETGRPKRRATRASGAAGAS
jgi:polyhydroxyalkanoate synthesis regulator phasin